MTTTRLSSIRPGSHWRIVPLASSVNAKAIESCRQWLESQGFQVSYGEHLFERDNDVLHLAGGDRERSEDLTAALTDPAVDVVLAARGGYGTMRLLPYLDLGRIQQENPKPVIGFSDITALHNTLASIGWTSIHGPNAHSQLEGPTGESLLQLLAGELEEITPHPMECLANPIRETVVAPWHGGNLALVSALVGTPYQPDWDGSVLYLEEVHEKPYRIDRMLQQLRLAGILDQVRGIVFGEALFDADPKDEAVKSLVRDIALLQGIPAWWGLKSGHSEPMFSLPLGTPLAIEPTGHVRLLMNR